VTCSTERQQDHAIVETAVRTLPEQGYFVVATTAAHSVESVAGASGPHVHIEEFLPHDPVIERAGVVVCHGGMGITQRALSRGVPVVVVPVGRDQPEVARRVEYAGAGVRLDPKDLNERTLAAAVERAAAMHDGASEIAAAFAEAGGDAAAADAFCELLAREPAVGEARPSGSR
jgi:UDP:flavonoid glycosyltransferase YjiC (YdhE family)